MSEDNEILLPCPFCGGEAQIIYDDHMWENHPNDRRDEYLISCCEIVSPEHSTKNEATNAWNTRKAQPLPDDVQGALDEVNKAIETLEGDGDENLVLDHLYDARAALVAQNQVIDKPVCGEDVEAYYKGGLPFPSTRNLSGEEFQEYRDIIDQAIVNMGNLHPDTRRSIMDFSALPDEVYIQVETLSDNEREFSLSPVPSPPETVTGNIVEQRYVLPPPQETCKENPTQGGDAEEALNKIEMIAISPNPATGKVPSNGLDAHFIYPLTKTIRRTITDQAAEIAGLREALELANEHFPDLWDEKEVPYHKMGKLSQDRMKIKKALQSSTSQATEKVDGWQSIESAPKGGGAELVTDPNWIDPPLILLRFPCGSVSAARWDWYYAEGGRGCKSGVAWIEPTSAEELIEHYGIPTHWQALPPVKEGE